MFKHLPLSNFTFPESSDQCVHGLREDSLVAHAALRPVDTC